MEKSIPHLLESTYRQHADREVLLMKRSGMYLGATYWQLWETVRRLTHGMAMKGIAAGEKIAIVSDNRPEWVYIDYAAFCMKCVVVPVSPALPPERIAAIIADAGCQVVFVDTMDRHQALVSLAASMPAVEHFFPFDTVAIDNEQTTFFRQLTALGEKHRKKQPDFYQKSLAEITAEQPATRIYSATSNGSLNSVLLNQQELVSEVQKLADTLAITVEDRFLSTLGLEDTLERFAGNWCAIKGGATIAYSGGAQRLFEDLAEVQPTILVNRAAFFNDLAERAASRASGKGGLFSFGSKDEKIREVLGGKLRMIVSGDSLSTETSGLFERLGISVQVPDLKIS